MKPILFPNVQQHLFRAALAASLVIVLYLSCIRIDAPLPGHFSDKFYHGLCFLVLAFLTDYAFPQSPFNAHKYLPLMAYGILIEAVQYFIPYRSFSWADMAADALGLSAYGLSAAVALRMLARKS